MIRELGDVSWEYVIEKGGVKAVDGLRERRLFTV